MKLAQIFSVFSRRDPTGEKRPKPLTAAFRSRILMLCRDRFSGVDRDFGNGDYREEFLSEVHRRFTYLIGRTEACHLTSRSKLSVWVVR